MQASDRFNINSQLEHLQAKYVGTGHADLTRFEWAVNTHRDSYASYVGHYPILAYFDVAENESIGRERYNFMQASDRFNINSQLEHLQAKYVGTGHADLTRFEWAVNTHRDSYASYVGHYPILAYFDVAENESIGRERYNFMQ
ncbi:hypothetical protein CASFOL_018415 [Castilleja foliolosa]|uniref:Splicing factor subunit n=1 Tax=Castilleja foliolosa TaxID=1961234 RepID=A0ABD3DB26_9LAMI